MYTNWLTQNSINIGSVPHMQLGQGEFKNSSKSANIPLSAIKGGIGAIGQGLSGNVGGFLSSTISTISGTLAELYQHSFISPQVAGNVNQGDVNSSNGNNDFYSYNICIKEEYARIIDNFFSVYGYKVNQVKIPNITGRQNWNFVKTIDCNVYGDIPEEDLDIIRAILDNGVTFWHNPSNFLNYNVSNSIV